MPVTSTRPSRAAALPPEERRAAIIAAARPLLVEHGTKVTSKQIADAAGIAEGTIFRVFGDKQELMRAVVDHALDTSSLDAVIRDIDRNRPLEERLEAAVAALQARISEVWRLLSAINETLPARRPPASPPDIPALAELFEPDRALLRHAPVDAARALQALTLAVSHPALYPAGPMAPAAIVDLLLGGVRARSGRPRRSVSSAAPSEGKRPC